MDPTVNTPHSQQQDGGPNERPTSSTPETTPSLLTQFTNAVKAMANDFSGKISTLIDQVNTWIESERQKAIRSLEQAMEEDERLLVVVEELERELRRKMYVWYLKKG